VQSHYHYLIAPTLMRLLGEYNCHQALLLKTHPAWSECDPGNDGRDGCGMWPALHELTMLLDKRADERMKCLF
jgi:hypothetical protein